MEDRNSPIRTLEEIGAKDKDGMIVLRIFDFATTYITLFERSITGVDVMPRNIAVVYWHFFRRNIII